jgi:hypothetical protein
VTLSGFELRRCSLPQLADWLLKFTDIKHEVFAQSGNEVIRTRYQMGEGLSDLANENSISPQRVFQIVNRKN